MSDIDPDFQNWTVELYRKGLAAPWSEQQFVSDLDALRWADTCVLVLPCGRSAHTEAGWMARSGRRTIVCMPEMQEAALDVQTL